MKHVILPFMLLLISCTCVENPTGTFACTQNDQCIDGYLCLDLKCQPAKTNRCPVVSCELDACEGLLCSEGRYCQRGSCACLEAGGAPEVQENSCSDGHDNDCDGRFDCLDADCAGACDAGVLEADAGVVDAGISSDAGEVDAGAHDAGVIDSGVVDAGPLDAGTIDSGVVDAGVLDAGIVDAGMVDPCDGIDCLSGQTCCGGTCVTPRSDPMNCGGCGLKCGAGQFCLSITVGGQFTGTCSCSGACPMSQTCSASSCTCSSSANCAPNGTCDFSSGLNGYCRP